MPSFIEARRKNWSYLKQNLLPFAQYFILPESALSSEPSWFGFVLTVRENAPFTRADIVKHLESNNIQTRMLFAGNLTKHPCFDELRSHAQGYRIVVDLVNTDMVMNRTFWIGVYPGLTPAMLERMVAVIGGYVKQDD